MVCSKLIVLITASSFAILVFHTHLRSDVVDRQSRGGADGERSLIGGVPYEEIPTVIHEVS
jgi:hypothetical protein